MSNTYETIDRLRGQLQNCVNHLDRVKRRYPSMQEKLSACIESANKSLYETLHEELDATTLQSERIAELEESLFECVVILNFEGFGHYDAVGNAERLIYEDLQEEA